MAPIPVIVVFEGGSNSRQSKLFTVARKLFTGFVDFIFISVEKAREHNWTLDEFIAEMGAGVIYIFLSHPLQGIINHPGGGGLPWDASQCADALWEGLKHLPGFPPRDELKCNTFTQDKYRYITDLQDVCIPTLQIMRTETGYMSMEVKNQIYEFCSDNYEMPQMGWIVKGPFLTGGSGRNGMIKYCTEPTQVLDAILAFHRKDECEHVPYFMLQPRLTNRKEYRVVLGENTVTGEIFPPFFATPHLKTSGKSFSLRHDLIQFALDIKARLKAFGYYCIAPLLRVDIVVDMCFKLKIIELESLEAESNTAGGRYLRRGKIRGSTSRGTNDCKFTTFQIRFWFDLLKQFLILYYKKFPDDKAAVDVIEILSSMEYLPDDNESDYDVDYTSESDDENDL